VAPLPPVYGIVALPLNAVLTVAVDDTTAELQVKAETEAVVVPSDPLVFLQATRMHTVMSMHTLDKSNNFFMI
jgi:hypothetical protein